MLFYVKLKQELKWELGKSLAREGIEKLLIQTRSSAKETVINTKQAHAIDKLRTFYEFIADEIVENTDAFIKYVNDQHLSQECAGQRQEYQILCTGGGSYNQFLISLLNKKAVSREDNCVLEFSVADRELVEFKEAIIFGFLGVKYVIGV